VTVDLPVPRRVLAIGAHPDDVEFGCGATLAKWSAAGTHAELLVLTDGSKGTWDAASDLDALVATRENEQRDAARAMGVETVRFLGLVDGELDSGLGNRARVCAAIRAARPDVLLGHDPWKRYRLHPDHRHAGFLTVDGLVAARDPQFFPDAGAPHRPSCLLLFEAEEPDHYESIEPFLPTKVAALLSHRSQWRSTMRIDRDAPDADRQRDAFASRVREVATHAGVDAGVGAAEAFKRIDDV
jgi:LmbE family N-acetylglucosaminyl deacetylase